MWLALFLLVVVQLLSCDLFATSWTAALLTSLSFTISWNSCSLSQWYHPTISSSVTLFSSCPQSLPASGSFPMNWLCNRWPKYWSFSFSFNISPSNEHSGLVSFKMNWLDLLAVQGTLKSLLQLHILKASILQHSAFFMVHLSHPYMTTGKTIVLTIWAFVGKVMSLFFNILSRFLITFLLRSKYLLISFTWKNVFEDYLCCSTYYSIFLWMNSMISTLIEYVTTFSSV